MLEPHTATFPCGSFSRKSVAAVAFQNLDPSINQHPWFTPHNIHTHTHRHTPSFLSLFSLPSFLHFHVSLLLSILSFPFLHPPFSLPCCPSIPLCFALHPSFSPRLSLQPPGHFRQAVCNRFINRLFSLCSKHSVGLGGRLSDTDSLVLNLRH